MAVCLCVGILFFAGCNPATGGATDGTVVPDVPGVSLKGYWKSDYGDGFEITDTTYTQYDSAAKDVSFAGTIVNKPNLYGNSGYIIIQITDSGSWEKKEGCYYVIRWKSLSERGVQQGSASSADWTADINKGLPTPTEAEAEYTEEKGYFGYYGTYAKQ
ncbi:MAG: hypothetical protein LBU99_05865 [Spirochaetaceae bacterium]|nr:hypothetical protein [Spirochaetaceae bacterium]